MKKKARFSIIVILSMIIIGISGCTKPPLPPPPTPVPATVKINSSNGLTMIGATVTFTVTPNDAQITQSGLAYSISDDSTGATKVATDQKIGIITETINGLNINTKYNIWAYTSTAKGTTYSSKIRIWTYGLMDYDGNGYHTVKIGNQTWTVENLKVTHYNNGDPIPEVQDSTIWLHDTKGARCYYNNNKTKYDSVYGALYNWYVVSDPRGIVPKGWHVPTVQEYLDLDTYLGNDSKAGGPMKEKGTKHWKAPNTGATNSSGFTALPGGMRGLTIQYKTLISFVDIGGYAHFWTSTRSPMQNSALVVSLDYNDTWFDVADSFENINAFSIRLVKDK